MSSGFWAGRRRETNRRLIQAGDNGLVWMTVVKRRQRQISLRAMVLDLGTWKVVPGSLPSSVCLGPVV